MKQSGPFYLACAFALAGSSVISARLLSGRIGTFTIAAVSLGLALIMLLPLCRGKLKKTFRQMRLMDGVMLVFQAFFGIFLFRICLLLGIARTSTAEAGLLTGATPAITAMLAWMLLKERVSMRGLAGVFLTVSGVLLLQGLITSRLSSAHIWGNLLIVGAAASESVFNVISRINAIKAENKKPLDPLVQTTLVCAIALALCAIPMLFEQPFAALHKIGLREWLALVWYGVFVTGLAFICWYAGIKRCNASTAAAFTGLMPFTSLLLSVLLLGEHTLWQQWAGGMLVIGGMLMIGIKKETTKPSLSHAQNTSSWQIKSR